MRALFLAISFVVVPAMPQKAGAPLKPFEFRGFVAGQKMSAEQEAHCRKSDFGPTFCEDQGDNKVAGVNVMSVYISASNGMISNVGIAADPIFFDVLTSAFKEKYGAPCKSYVSKWVGELGNSRPNPTMVWCFKSGKLTAKMYGARLDVSEIDYRDDNQPVYAKAKSAIDF